MASERGPNGQRKSASNRYYDQFAKSGLYDVDAKETGWASRIEELAERTLSLKPPEEVSSFLELGVGTGLSLDAILRRAQVERIVAVDASSEMIELLRKKHPDGVEAVQDTIEGYVADSDETFDLITAWSVAELLPDLPDTIGRVGRLLKPGGVFAFTYVPLREGEPRETVVDSTEQIGEIMTRHAWAQTEIEPRLADSGLVIADRIDSMVSHRYGEFVSHYNFVVAAKP